MIELKDIDKIILFTLSGEKTVRQNTLVRNCRDILNYKGACAEKNGNGRKKYIHYCFCGQY
jgi:hypothetical protein